MKVRWLLPLLLAALVASTTLAGCSVLIGTNGNIYGAVDGYYGQTLYTTGLYSTGGFPYNAYEDTYYQFQPGYYYFTYYYYGYSPVFVQYTVTANQGALLTDGTDKYFDIYCYDYVVDVVGAYNVTKTKPSLVNPDGSVESTYAVGNYTVTIKSQKVSTMPAGAVPLQKK